MRPNFRVSRQGRCAAALPGPYATRTVLAGPFDRPNRIGPGARRGAPRRKADAQLREFLELGQARARGQAEHMAAACPVGGQEVEMPARHIDGAGRGGKRNPISAPSTPSSVWNHCKWGQRGEGDHLRAAIDGAR